MHLYLRSRALRQLVTEVISVDEQEIPAYSGFQSKVLPKITQVRHSTTTLMQDHHQKECVLIMKVVKATEVKNMYLSFSWRLPCLCFLLGTEKQLLYSEMFGKIVPPPGSLHMYKSFLSAIKQMI